MSMTRIILGSQSPRRKEILGYFSLPFEQAVPPYDEEAQPFHGDPAEYVKRLSEGKAASLAPVFPDAVIITADTTVFCNGNIYGKPTDQADSFRMLTEMSGQWHTVYTGVTVTQGDESFSDVEATRVLFHQLSPEQIRLYQTQLHCQDKAGSYLIQQSGSLIVAKIDGCYYNVVGLPINTLCALLKQTGIDLWRHLS